MLKRKRKASSEDDAILFRGKRYDFEESNAALCVPVELRRSFRKLSKIDRSVRPGSAKDIAKVFSRCCALGGNRSVGDRAKGHAKDSVFGSEGVEESCIIWTTKQTDVDVRDAPRGDTRILRRGNAVRSDNMNVWMNKCNRKIRSVMYEWFVAPKGLSESEVEAYAKRRGGTRKRGREIKMTCDNAVRCINPFHMTSSVELAMDVQERIKAEGRGVSRAWVGRNLKKGSSRAARHLENAYTSSMFILNRGVT
jgi:hypothetical protein